MCLTSAGLRQFGLLLILLLGSSGCRQGPEAPIPSQAPSNPSPISTLTASPAISYPSSENISDIEKLVDDLRIRQAIDSCTDRTALLNAAYPWLQEPSAFLVDSFIPPWYQTAQGWGRNLFKYDPEKGKALLESAGWIVQEDAQYRTDSDGRVLALQLITTTAAVHRAWTEAFVGQMKACGMQVTVDYQEAALFFKDKEGTLGRGDFDLAAFAWVFRDTANGSDKIYICDEIPVEKNGGTGQNVAGWCNSRADHAARQAAASLDAGGFNDEMTVVQEEYARDLPGLPLFARLEVLAANPDLMNFMPDINELYTWNAAQWAIPGRDSIVIGERSEPAGLAIFETSYVAQLIRALVYGLDYTRLDGDFQPIMLKSIPSLENDGANLDVVEVSTGDMVVDVTGNPVELQPGSVCTFWMVKSYYSRGRLFRRANSPCVLNLWTA